MIFEVSVGPIAEKQSFWSKFVLGCTFTSGTYLDPPYIFERGVPCVKEAGCESTCLVRGCCLDNSAEFAVGVAASFES